MARVLATACAAWRSLLAGVSAGAIAASAARAADPTTEVVELDPLSVGTEREEAPAFTWSAASLSGGLAGSLATRLEALPGVALAQRGGFSEEPVIGGMGFDRVATTFAGLPLPSGSPTRTHAAIQHLGADPLRQVEVAATLPSLTLGPPVSGGWILVDPLGPTSASELPESGRDASANLAFAVLPDRQGWSGVAAVGTADPRGRVGFAVSGLQQGDYRAGDGREIHSGHEAWNASLSALVTQGERGRIAHTLDAIYHQHVLTEHAVLPLDTVGGEFVAVAASHGWWADPERTPPWRLRYGHSESRIDMDNSRRPGAPLPICSRAETRSTHADLQWSWDGRDSISGTCGLDLNLQRHDALRLRGDSGRDRIWPDVRSVRYGAYTEIRLRWDDSRRLRLGLRWDRARHEARRINENAFGTPLRSLYEIFNDISRPADGAPRTEELISANALFRQAISRHSTLHLGIGSTAQTAPPTERFRGLLESLGGGFEIGNPALQAERKIQTVVGITHTSRPLTLRAEGFIAVVEDYVWRQRVGTTAGLPSAGPAQIVHGYRNVDAAFAGAHLAGSWRATPSLEFLLTAEWIEARLREDGPGFRDGDRLPELPPGTVRIGFIHRGKVGDHPVAFRWMSQWLAARGNPLPELVPLYRDARSTWLHDVGCELRLHDGRLALQIQIRNLFNTLHFPYLAPPLHQPGGPGSPLPAPGRTWALSCHWGF